MFRRTQGAYCKYEGVCDAALLGVACLLDGAARAVESGRRCTMGGCIMDVSLSVSLRSYHGAPHEIHAVTCLAGTIHSLRLPKAASPINDGRQPQAHTADPAED